MYKINYCTKKKAAFIGNTLNLHLIQNKNVTTGEF